MQRKILNLLTLLALLFGLVATVRPQPVLADCQDGGGGDDTIVCDTDITSTTNNDDDVDGGLGNDTITVTAGASNVDDVDGDGADDAGGSDVAGSGNGGDDTIVIDGVVGGVSGDFVEDGVGGNDTITVNGEVAGSVVGDDVISNTYFGQVAIGGDDTITISESGAVGQVAGDGNGTEFGGCEECGVDFYGGNDNIFVNGYVDGDVSGEGDYGLVGECLLCGIYSQGGADQIITGVNSDTGPVAGEGSYFEVGECETCGITAYGGDDSITVNGATFGSQDGVAIAGDGIYAETYECADCGNYVTGGQDTIVVNGAALGNVYGDGLANYVYDCDGCGSATYGGNDQITINGYMYEAYVSGDGIDAAGNEDDYAQGGNDTIVVNSSAYIIVLGDDINAFEAQGGNDTLIVSQDGAVYGIEGDGLYSYYGQGGDDTIIVNGFAYYVEGDGMSTSTGVTLAGPGAGVAACASDLGCVGPLDGGNDTITINGVAGYVAGDYVDGCAGNDTININGDVLYDVYGDYAVANCISLEIPVSVVCPDASAAPCGLPVSGNDTVNIGAGGVSYSQVCGDIDVTTVDRRQGTVGGIIDGDYTENDAGYDTLNFGLVTANQGEADSLAAYLAGFDPNGGTVEVNGQTYNYQNFEELNVNATIYTEGATRIYDDGVTLAFAVADGIQICNGPSGLKAGLIDYGRLTAGQREFEANGFVVTLEDVGSQHFKMHVWKDGVEQFDDADGDGVADDLFVFGF